MLALCFRPAVEWQAVSQIFLVKWKWPNNISQVHHLASWDHNMEPSTRHPHRSAVRTVTVDWVVSERRQISSDNLTSCWTLITTATKSLKHLNSQHLQLQPKILSWSKLPKYHGWFDPNISWCLCEKLSLSWLWVVFLSFTVGFHWSDIAVVVYAPQLFWLKGTI